jgi:hypothetical protein
MTLRSSSRCAMNLRSPSRCAMTVRSLRRLVTTSLSPRRSCCPALLTFALQKHMHIGGRREGEGRVKDE